MFSESKKRARSRYRQQMHDGPVLNRQEAYATIDQRLQGNEEFVEQVLEQYDGPVEGRRKKKEHTLPALARAIETRHDIALEDMRTATKQQSVSLARKVFAHTAKEFGYQGKEIAEYLKKTPVSVTMYLRPDGDVSKAAVELIQHLDGKNINSEV